MDQRPICTIAGRILKGAFWPISEVAARLIAVRSNGA